MRASKAIAGIVIDAGYRQNACLLTATGAGQCGTTSRWYGSGWNQPRGREAR